MLAALPSSTAGLISSVGHGTSRSTRWRPSWLVASASAAEPVGRLVGRELVRPESFRGNYTQVNDRQGEGLLRRLDGIGKQVLGHGRMRVEHPHFDIGAPARGEGLPGGDDPAAIQDDRREQAIEYRPDRRQLLLGQESRAILPGVADKQAVELR